MNKIIDVKNINLGYDGKTIISNASMSIVQNDFIGIIGPNGGGKTTLLKALLGLIKPFSGNITYYKNGTASEHINIGYLPQINQQDKKFPISVLDVVLSGAAKPRDWLLRHSAEQKRQAWQLLEQMNIHDYANAAIGELSGGQRQRAFLCRALMSEPDILALDEPNTYVDNRFEQQLYDILKQLNNRMAIVLVSHDVGTIVSHVKTVACVNRSVYYHPNNELTPEILQVYNCPIDLIAHGNIPHRVLHSHTHTHVPKTPLFPVK